MILHKILIFRISNFVWLNPGRHRSTRKVKVQPGLIENIRTLPNINNLCSSLQPLSIHKHLYQPHYFLSPPPPSNFFKISIKLNNNY